MNEAISEGFILNTKAYKENDAMMWVYLQHNGLKHFIYKGYYKPGSKRLGQGLPFNLYEFRFTNKNSLITPKEIRLVNSYLNIQENINLRLLATDINAIFLQFHQHLNYSLYHWALTTLQKNRNPQLVFCLCLIECLNQLGLQPYVDGDVNTDSTVINHFDIKLGGMVFRNIASIYSVEELKLIRTLFKAKPINYSIISHVQINSKLFNLIVDYFEFHTGINLKSVKLYQELQ